MPQAQSAQHATAATTHRAISMATSFRTGDQTATLRRRLDNSEGHVALLWGVNGRLWVLDGRLTVLRGLPMRPVASPCCRAW